MHTEHKDNARRERAFVSSLAVLLLLIVNLSAGIKLGMDHALPGARNRHIQYIAAAISAVVYDVGGYVYSDLVYSMLTRNGMGEPTDTSEAGLIRHFTNGGTLNAAMAAAASLPLDAVRASPTIIMGLEDLGYIEFLKTSYRIFGVKYSSAYFGYFLLLGLSVGVFLLLPPLARTYSVAIILIFLLAHLALMQVIPNLGYEFLSITNVRFFSALGLLPLIYLVCAVLAGAQRRSWGMVGVALESLLLSLNLVTRSSGLWMLAYLALIWAFALLYHRVRGKWGYTVSPDTPRAGMVVLGMILALWAAMNVSVNLRMSPQYDSEGGVGAHLFWHNGFTSLPSHPELRTILADRYHAGGDALGFAAALEKLRADGRPEAEWRAPPGVPWPAAPAIYEQAIRELYLELLRDHPRYVLEKLVYYQPQQTLAVLEGIWSQGISERTFRIVPMLTLLTVVILLASAGVYARWLVTPIMLVALLAAFAALPTIWGGAAPWLLGEAALLSICLFYLLLVVAGLAAAHLLPLLKRRCSRQVESRSLLSRVRILMPEASEQRGSLAVQAMTLGLIAGLIGTQGDVADRSLTGTAVVADQLKAADLSNLVRRAAALEVVQAEPAADVRSRPQPIASPGMPPASVLASSFLSPSQGPESLFDPDETRNWHIDISTRWPTEWVVVDLGATQRSSVSYLRMMPRPDVPSQFFTRAVLAGSNDGTTWHVVASLAAQSPPAARWVGWNIAPTGRYRYFKLVIPNDIPEQFHTFYSISKLELYP